MEKTGYTTAQGLEVERLLNALESVPKEKQPIMAVLAEAFINGMKAQDKLVAASRSTAAPREMAVTPMSVILSTASG